MKNEVIYLDNNSTTPVDPRVVEEMLPYFTDDFGNAASSHQCGMAAHKAVKKSREQVSELISCDASEIVFTSGATEAINLGIKGLAELSNESKRHIITVSTEHPAVLDTCRYLEKKGFKVTYLPVKNDGLIDIDILKKSLNNDTFLVSVMLVNNETGVIQPIKEISDIAHANGTLFMSDATQAVGKMPVNVNEMGIDIMSFSGHKFYGPKGIGGLYVRGRRPNKVKLEAIIHGGGHERGLRSGTLNVPGIVGLGMAAEIAKKEMNGDEKRVGTLRNNLENKLLKIENTFLNGNPEKRLYNLSNICFKGIDADAMIVGLKNIAVSKGSACSTESIEPSHVLRAMGLSDKDAYSSLRISFGRFNYKEDCDAVLFKTKNVVRELRNMAK